jgi:hypothetical protein
MGRGLQNAGKPKFLLRECAVFESLSSNQVVKLDVWDRMACILGISW